MKSFISQNAIIEYYLLQGGQELQKFAIRIMFAHIKCMRFKAR